ncbi:MAG TPA: shikimate kinase [Phycisphaerae bacterium]|nr:shikimate kinase [Phycisphaerae bacterium]
MIGYRGCGKTAVGRLLADKLGWAFVDTDTLVELRSGKTIRDIYADQGEDGFRKMETQVIADVARLDWHIISTGGGALQRPDNAQVLKAAGKVVWLVATPEVLWERIAADTSRRFSRPQQGQGIGLQGIRAALREFEPVYAGWADLVLDTTGQSQNEVAEEIIAKLNLQKRNQKVASSIPCPHV